MTNEILNYILDRIRQATLTPCIKLTAYRHETMPWQSKLGGEPYLPLDVAYPTAPDGTPLRFLAQLNFAELPSLPHFPQKGILQFYILSDDLYGADFDAPTQQSGFKILYHPTVIMDRKCLQAYIPQEEDDDDTYFPFSGSFALEGRLADSMLSPSDWRFNALFLKYAESIDPNYQPSTDFYKLLDKSQYDLLIDYCQCTGHLISGYPFFMQYDPREGDYEDHSILLFQIDSDGTGSDEICWGDCGVANFFITPEALASLDFSNVLYTWDCG